MCELLLRASGFTKLSSPCPQRQTRPTQLVVYLVDCVVPRLEQLSADAQLEVLKPLAEMAQYCGELEDTPARCDRVYTALTVSTPRVPAVTGSIPR